MGGGGNLRFLEGESFLLTMCLIPRNILHSISMTFLGNINLRKHDSPGRKNITCTKRLEYLLFNHPKPYLDFKVGINMHSLIYQLWSCVVTLCFGFSYQTFCGYSCNADWYFPNAMQFLDGWVIFAEYARPRPPPGQSLNNNSPQYGRQWFLLFI